MLSSTISSMLNFAGMNILVFWQVVTSVRVDHEDDISMCERAQSTNLAELMPMECRARSR